MAQPAAWAASPSSSPKAAGAIVYATASTRSLPHVRALGADEVIDYKQQNFELLARDIDLVVDLVGGEVVDRSWALLSPDGLLVSIAAPDVGSRAPQGRRGVFLPNKPDTARLAAIAQQPDSKACPSDYHP